MSGTSSAGSFLSYSCYASRSRHSPTDRSVVLIRLMVSRTTSIVPFRSHSFRFRKNSAICFASCSANSVCSVWFPPWLPVSRSSEFPPIS